MKDLKERGKAALAALAGGHVTPRNVELITNYVADSLKVESGADVDVDEAYKSGFKAGEIAYAESNAKVKETLKSATKDSDSKEDEKVATKVTDTTKKK